MSKTKAPTPRQVAAASLETQREAQALLEEVGTPELAPSKLSSSESRRSLTNDQFAQRCGFASYLSMFEASKPIAELQGRNWLVTNVGPEQWIVWNEQDLTALRYFKTPDEAKQFIRQLADATLPQDPPPTG